jgi:hypothetical protein
LNKPETANSNAQIQLHPVLKRVTANTKGDQVLHVILTELAPSLQVMDLPRSARLSHVPDTFPGQNFIDLAHNEHGPELVDLGRHHTASVNPQVHQANQGLRLLVCESNGYR